MGINNPNITIQYRAFIKNADTGEVVLPNASVPVGTNLELAFDEHVTEDIYWFGTGGYLDSPYGDWGDPDDAPPIQCLDKDYVGGNPDPVLSYASYRNYISFVVQPPSKSIDGMSTEQLSCTSFDGSKQPCTAVKAGTLPLVFNFASTDGKMYGRSYGVHSNVCFGINTPMTVKLGAYWKASTRAWETFFAPGGGATTQTIAVSQESIPYPITVVDAVGQPPTTPKLSANANGACTVGTAHSISMAATDSDGDNIRYGIDWDADGTIDQFVPPSGYVSSGTTQSASRTYSIAGSKTVKVLAQDEGGLSSAWATITFTCADSATASLNDNDNDNTNENNSAAPTAAVLDLRVIPSLVKSGNTTKVNWSATGVSSCTVTAPNADAWSTLQSAIGGEISKPITAETRYTLSCIDAAGTTLTKTATVNILPTFQEI